LQRGGGALFRIFFQAAQDHALDRALDILSAEAKDGMLDAELLTTFIAARVFESLQAPPKDLG